MIKNGVESLCYFTSMSLLSKQIIDVTSLDTAEEQMIKNGFFILSKQIVNNEIVFYYSIR